MPLSKNCNFGELIRRMRHFRGFKQFQAAHKLGITQQAYSKRERSLTLTLTLLHETIVALGCTSEEFEKMNGCPSSSSSSIGNN